jgi:two-component system, chemotaxis family, sensor kinase CheA
MSISAAIREQLLRSFRAELAEHVQSMTDGLLSLEQRAMEPQERQELLETIFRAAHSLKGAARAVGATAIEQLAHALESVLDGLRSGTLSASAGMFTACYAALDAIRVTLAVYESGELTPPVEALQALAQLGTFQPERKPKPEHETARPQMETSPAELPTQAAASEPSASQPEGEPAAKAQKTRPRKRKLEAVISERLAGLGDAASPDPCPEAQEFHPVVAAPQHSQEFSPAAAGQPVSPEAGEAHPGAVGGNGVPLPANGKPAVDRLSSNGETIRVSVNKLDALMAQLSELMVTKMRTEQRLSQIKQFQEFIGLWQKEWLNARSSYGRLARRNGINLSDGPAKDFGKLMEFAEVSQDHLRQMNAWVNELGREFNNDSTQMSLVIDKLEEEIKRVRMLPLSTITGAFGRMVRDLAQELDKEAILDITGGDTELDKQVLEQIKDPIIHLLRNAIDHGIEMPDYRASIGKARAGKITLNAAYSGKDVVITIADDGDGIDIEGLRRSTLRKRGPEAQTMTDTELVETMFQTGITTSTMVTDISGRGVGLDVVRRNVETLNGRIDVNWQPGQGTTFKLTLPLRLTGSRGLLVRVSGQTFILPIISIERIMLIQAEAIISLEGHDTILYNNRPVTLTTLEAVLNLPHMTGSRQRQGFPVIILSSAERRMAFVVDELLGEQEVVVKDLGRQLVRVGGIAGAAVMGSGEVMLILNPNDLIKLALRAGLRSVFGPSSQEAEGPDGEVAENGGKERKRILIVDDSLTTRTLEKNILEAAGYTVLAATDGEEVLSIIATEGAPDLLISDVTMPRMNGFELTNRIKNDPHLSRTPVILVTSLESPEDKARGIEVGADAYIVKGRFDQNHLLETVEQLI